MADNDYEADPRFDEDDRQYGSRDRSRSPRGNGQEGGSRQRSASPNGRDRYDSRDAPQGDSRGEGQGQNSGSNLFVTGINPNLNENDLMRMFEKYGPVKSCNIMRDPHSQESRGFGFVEMVTSEAADAAKDALSGQNIEGRTLSIEKARRGRPRTPTPGKYYGPPKRDGFRGGRGGGGGPRRFDSYDDRRGGGGYGGRRDDHYGGGGRYGGGRPRGDRYDDRYGGGGDGYGSSGGYGGSRGGGRDDREYGRREDRYREDRYRSDDRRGYGGGNGGGSGSGGGGYGRDDRGGGGGGYSDAPRGEPRGEPRQSYASGDRA